MPEVKFRVDVDKPLQEFIKGLPYGSRKTILSALAWWFIGTKGRGLKSDEPQKYVSRKQAGYKTSQAQMGYFFAKGILEKFGGTIKLNHYKRTGDMSDAWYVKETTRGYTLVNPTAAAHWVRDDRTQTRQHAMAGRRKVTAVVMSNMKSALIHANKMLKDWLKRRGKK